MNSSSIRTKLPAALVATVMVLLGTALMPGLTTPASAADYTAQQRKEYFDSGKYGQDLRYVAARARKFIIRRTQPTIRIVRACKRSGFRLGRKDRGPDPDADYSVPVKVPKWQMPDRIVRAPKPGPGPVTDLRRPRLRYPKAKKPRHITRRRCRKMPKLAIAMDMDETAASSFRFGSAHPDYETAMGGVNLGSGTQTALRPMRKIYKLARRRGVAAFVITARPDIEALREITERNLRKIGYRHLAGLYLKPLTAPDKAVVKNSQRAEISRRRGYRIIAMFGDQNSDLRTGFYQRGFKYQSAYTGDQD